MDQSLHVWAVVRVWRGLPEHVAIFLDEQAALDFMEKSYGKLPMEDEVAVFKVPMPQAKECDATC